MYIQYLFIYVFLQLFWRSVQTEQANKLINSIIWGPGLEPHIIVMPARYFFIKAGSNTRSPAEVQEFDVRIQGLTKTKRPCRIWSNVLDRKDGSYIVRYKLYETCDDLKISVKYNDTHVAESPYIIKEKVYTEDCYCPTKNVEKLLEQWKCGDVPNQIKSDLGLFHSIDWNILRDKIIDTFDKPNAISLCHYLIKNNVIYRKCYGKYVGFKMFMDSMLLSLTRKALLKDTEFFVNLGDWPLVNSFHEKFPIFSWCGSTDTFDIVMPTYDITESTLENMGRVMLDMLSVQGNVKGRWETKIPKVFWRGRDSNRERLKLIDISRNYPDLFNVSLTNFFFFRDEQETYGPKSEHVSFFSFFDYKYQLSIDGTVAAYRLPYLLAGASLLFKQTSKYYEHFYGSLVPHLHYIPVKTDISDLLEKIYWAKANDEEAQKIAQAGQNFASENLLPKNIFCYYSALLNEFTKLIVSDVRLLDGMEIVEQPVQSRNCGCKIFYKDEL